MGVLLLLGKLMRSPPTVILVRYTSSFCGRMLQQMRPYVARLCRGTCAFWMKNHVSVPLMFLMTWRRRPNSLAKLVVQIFLVFSDLMRCRYSRKLPVVSWMTASMKCLVEYDRSVRGCMSCWAANLYPHTSGFWVGGLFIWESVMMQLMMCAAQTLSWCRLGNEACPWGE